MSPKERILLQLVALVAVLRFRFRVSGLRIQSVGLADF